MLHHQRNADDTPRDGNWRFRLYQKQAEVGKTVKMVAPYLFDLLAPIFISSSQSNWSAVCLPNTVAMTEIVGAEVDHWPFFEEFCGTLVLENVPELFNPRRKMPERTSTLSSVPMSII